jgi:hypothetical protein
LSDWNVVTPTPPRRDQAWKFPDVVAEELELKRRRAVSDQSLDERKELALLEAHVSLEQLSHIAGQRLVAARQSPRQSVQLLMLEESPRDERLRLLGVGNEWEQLLFLFAEVADGFLGEEAREGSGRRGCVVVERMTEPPGGHEGVMVVMRKRNQSPIALHSSTLAAAVAAMSRVER